MGPNLGLSFNEYKHYLSRGLKWRLLKLFGYARWNWPQVSEGARLDKGEKKRKREKEKTFGCFDLQLIVADEEDQESLDNRKGWLEDGK